MSGERPKGALLRTIHEEVRSVAAQFGIGTDGVMLLVGIYRNDLSVTCDPLYDERFKRMMQTVRTLERYDSLADAVEAIVEGALAVGEDERS